ncbi:MAG: OadG family protein [Treponema sp.]|jgi:oxaloacetate decarboxylase gamma subunit|nr:OadG family protein [Treponema sp.]
MTIVDMLEQSGVLTLLGMGIVFSFLIVMVICITFVGRGIRLLGLDKDAGALPQAVSAGPSASDKSTAVTAAISAAVTEYRKEREGKN